MSTMTNQHYQARTRGSYAAVASVYADASTDELTGKPFERAVLTYFASLVPHGKVLDVDAGPGRVTSHLSALGLDISGVDAAPSMVALARDEHPDLRFEVATPTRLPVPDRSLAGLVAFSSIRVPDDQLPAVLKSFRRALVPGGVALFGFEVGSWKRGRPEPASGGLSPQLHGRRPEQMADQLGAAGLHVSACLLRDAEGLERAPHAFLIARKTGD